MKTILSCKNLTKTFNTIPVLEDVSFEVKEGEIFGIYGPNKSGKTTLLKILSTLILPTSGNALINNHGILTQPKETRKIISWVSSEERSFYWRLTGRQNLEFFASLHNLSKKVSEERTSELISYFGLNPDSDKLFYLNSAGTKQKFAIARGLLNDPKLMIIDEFEKSIDEESLVFICEKLKKLATERNMAIVFASHNKELLTNLANNSLELRAAK